MEIIVFALSALIVFALIAWLCGYDSTERYDSSEWERRGNWQGFNQN